MNHGGVASCPLLAAADENCMLMSLEIFLDAYNIRAQQQPGAIKKGSVLNGLNTILDALEEACGCSDSLSYCSMMFSQIRNRMSSVGVLLKKEHRPDLSNNGLKHFLDDIYPTLPCKGPEDQVPTELNDPDRFYCPICFSYRKKFADMRGHLRDKHQVDNEQLDELFPLGKNTNYLQCLGRFSPAQAGRNGIKRTFSSHNETSSQVSALARLEEETTHDEMLEDNAQPISDQSKDLDNIGALHFSIETSSGLITSDNDNPSRLVLDPRLSLEELHDREDLHGQHVPPLLPAFTQPATPIRKGRPTNNRRRGSSQSFPSTEFWSSPSRGYGTFSTPRSSRSDRSSARQFGSFNKPP